MEMFSCRVARRLVMALLVACGSWTRVSASTSTASKPITGNDFSSSSTSSTTSHVHVEGILWPLAKDLEHDPIVVMEPSSENPTTTTAVATKLRLNGAGVRSIRIFGWDFKVYVAGFYHAAGLSPLATTEQVYQAVQEHPMQFDFTFLRTVGQAQVTEAWQRQLETSVDHFYEEYEQDRNAFIASFGPIVSGGTVSVTLHPCGRTVLIDQGARKATILSRNFQLAFLSMWFGSKAVHPDLKEGLLGRIGNFLVNHHHHGDHPTTTAVEERAVDITGQ